VCVDIQSQAFPTHQRRSNRPRPACMRGNSPHSLAERLPSAGNGMSPGPAIACYAHTPPTRRREAGPNARVCATSHIRPCHCGSWGIIADRFERVFARVSNQVFHSVGTVRRERERQASAARPRSMGEAASSQVSGRIRGGHRGVGAKRRPLGINRRLFKLSRPPLRKSGGCFSGKVWLVPEPARAGPARPAGAFSAVPRNCPRPPPIAAWASLRARIDQ
jgi:hypothetical protein